MNRFFIGLIAGAAGIISGTYYYHTKIKKEIDEKGVFHREFGKVHVTLYKDKEEYLKKENNNAAEA